MRCIKCGNEIPDGTKFCLYCGSSQETPGVEQVTQAVNSAVNNATAGITNAYRNTDKIYTNVGEKLRQTAKIVLWVYIGYQAVLALIFLIQSFDSTYTAWYVITNLLSYVFGAFRGWILSVVLYAAGDLIDTVHSK